MNRFVWDMRHIGMPGIPTAYIEASYKGHKVIPGSYQARLIQGEQVLETRFEVTPNPLYDVSQSQYVEFHQAMSKMEANLTNMHEKTNRLYKIQGQLNQLLKSLPDKEELKEVREEGDSLLRTLKAWDEEMVQRKSKAYDDVENFPNKFTAEYLFLINQTESGLPRVTQASRDRQKELDRQWKGLEKRANRLLNTTIPEFNQQLWKKKIGALWVGQDD